VCGRVSPELFSSGQGGAVCTGCAEIDAGPASPQALGYLAAIAAADMAAVGNEPPREIVVRKEARALLYGFAEYHLERRMRSLPMLARGMSGSLVP